MATGNKLEVGIGADVTDFKKKIQEVESDIRELSKVKLDQLKLGLDTKEINAQIKDAKSSLATLKDSVGKTGNAIGGQFTKQTANGGNALMQFSRIAQDAPFGIMGIGNNITATTEAFGYLKAQTGSTGGALKAMASSLMGSGGILLGVSLLTTGLTLLSQSGLSVGDIIDKVTGKFDEFGGAIKKASEEAVTSTSGEIFGLKSLVAVAQDETKARRDRTAAVNELQSKYPAYFGNLSKEQIMTENLTGVVNELAQALINKEIGQNLAKAAAPQLLALYKLNAVYKQQRQALTDQNKTVRDAIEVYGDQSQTAKEAIATQEGLYNQLEKTRGEIYKATETNKRYTESINAINGSASKLLIKTPPKEKVKAKVAKTFDTPQLKPIESQITQNTSFVTDIALPTGKLDEFKNKIKEMPGVIKTSMGEIKVAVDTGGVDVMEALINFNESANKLIAGAFTDTFMSLGTMIGNSLAGADGGLEDAGKNILGILGGFLVQFGELMIETGIGLVIAKKMITSGNGYAMIAGGVALVAIGTAFAASSKKIQKSGGDSFGGGASTSTGSGANNSSTTSGSFSGGGGIGSGTVVFEIAGTSLIGVLNNTTARNLRIGGRN